MSDVPASTDTVTKVTTKTVVEPVVAPTVSGWMVFFIVLLILLVLAAILLFFLLPKPRDVRVRGQWVSGNVYSEGDIVTYEGNTYISAINGNTSTPSPTSGEWLLIGSTEGVKPSRFLIWLDQSSTAAGTPDGSVARPFKTMQDALNKVVADPQHPVLQGYTIAILGGDFTSETPVYSPTMEKNLEFQGYGEILLSTFTWNVPAAGGNLAFHSINQVERVFGAQGAITFVPEVTGNIFVNNASATQRPILSFINVQGSPLLDGTNTGAGNGFQLSIQSSRIGPMASVLPNPAGFGWRLQHAYNSRLTDMKIEGYGLIDTCYLSGTTTILSATSSGGEPQGIYNTFIEGTVSGPVGVLRCDETTNFFLNQQAVVALGGATAVPQEQQFAPAVVPQTWP